MFATTHYRAHLIRRSLVRVGIAMQCVHACMLQHARRPNHSLAMIAAAQALLHRGGDDATQQSKHTHRMIEMRECLMMSGRCTLFTGKTKQNRKVCDNRPQTHAESAAACAASSMHNRTQAMLWLHAAAYA